MFRRERRLRVACAGWGKGYPETLFCLSMDASLELPSGPWVLMVEDDPLMADLVQRGLKIVSSELVCLHERSGDVVAGRLLASWERGCMPCFVLLDMRPAGIGAVAVLAAVQSIAGLPTCPVVVYSGAVAAAERHRVLLAGARDVFEKPDRFEDLVAQLRALLARWGPVAIEA